MQTIASVEAVAVILSGITLFFGFTFLKSLASNLAKEAAPDIWNLIRTHVRGPCTSPMSHPNELASSIASIPIENSNQYPSRNSRWRLKSTKAYS